MYSGSRFPWELIRSSLSHWGSYSMPPLASPLKCPFYCAAAAAAAKAPLLRKSSQTRFTLESATAALQFYRPWRARKTAVEPWKWLRTFRFSLVRNSRAKRPVQSRIIGNGHEFHRFNDCSQIRGGTLWGVRLVVIFHFGSSGYH